LNIIAQRYRNGKVKGTLAFNDQKLSADTVKKYGGYVMQDDIMITSLTVRDTLRYAAMLRLPQSMSISDKFAEVDKLMVKLGLVRCADTRIGDPMHRGVSGGERKRVAIGVEMISKPRMLLLDEPTSGLDSIAALTVVKLLAVIAAEGTTVITTIHQPSSKIFSMFDKLLVLSRGEVAYYGDAQQALTYFASLGFECPPLYNPADFFLDVCSADPANAEEVEQARLNSAILVEQYQQNNKAHAEAEAEELLAGGKLKRTRYSAKVNMLWQFGVLLLRTVHTLLLGWPLLLIQFLLTIIMAFLVGGYFWKMPLETQYIQRRFMALFFIIINQGVVACFTVINVFPEERVIMLRERASGTYSTLPYFLAKSLSELPLQTIFPLLYGMIVYWMIGLQNDFVKWVHFMLITELSSASATSLGFAVSAWSKTSLAACIITPFILEVWRLFGGFYSIGNRMNGSIDWINYISYIRWGFDGLADNEFHGIDFVAPDGSIVTGQQALDNALLDDARYWISEIVLIGMIVAYRIIAYAGARFNKG
jgi:ABC-type multidrug transport system ATPase subunit/ABC-type multidrug transport system permease subunit